MYLQPYKRHLHWNKTCHYWSDHPPIMNLNTHLNQTVLTIFTFVTCCLADFETPNPGNQNPETDSALVGESKNILDILYPNRASLKPVVNTKHFNYR